MADQNLTKFGPVLLRTSNQLPSYKVRSFTGEMPFLPRIQQCQSTEQLIMDQH